MNLFEYLKENWKRYSYQLLSFVLPFWVPALLFQRSENPILLGIAGSTTIAAFFVSALWFIGMGADYDQEYGGPFPQKSKAARDLNQEED